MQDEEPQPLQTFYGSISRWLLIEVTNGPRDGCFDLMIQLNTESGVINFTLPDTEWDKMLHAVDACKRRARQEKLEYLTENQDDSNEQE